MTKKNINKIVGRISDDVVEKYKLYDYRNEEIVQSLNLYKHVVKHANEFETVDSFNHTLSNISEIIKDPIFVYYDPNRNSLSYFKEIDENVCAVVKLKLKKNKDTYVVSVFPVNFKKIEKLKEKSYIINR